MHVRYRLTEVIELRKKSVLPFLHFRGSYVHFFFFFFSKNHFFFFFATESFSQVWIKNLVTQTYQESLDSNKAHVSADIFVFSQCKRSLSTAHQVLEQIDSRWAASVGIYNPISYQRKKITATQ